ncbi:MAG TPA: homogentisate 1,2-dioxygenase [Anaeromyxobacteraceae bacterium]|jgi:homogentisate 1,2-dioxygenase|nr:homogentisate 1,2-dioxygenase [Anaeromyxobacteraceae bacterium]
MIGRLQLGEVPRKHHLAFRDPEGRLRHEEAFTRQGFDGPYTLAYHLNRPHASHAAPARGGFPLPEASPPRSLLRRHYRSQDLAAPGGPATQARRPLLFNEDLVIGLAAPSAEDPVYFANGDGDDLWFVFEGGGVVRSPLGDLPFSQGDYLLVPRGLLHRFLPDAGPQRWLSLEFAGGVGLPRQWRNEVGQLRMDAPFSQRDFRAPLFRGPLDEGIRELLVKRGGAFHGFRLDASPLDVVGWDGAVYPVAFQIRDFQPRVGLVHLPPTWHGTFAARGALVCSFVPRPLDFHPEAVPCPYPHASVDVDEVIFYVSGEFTSRRGIGPGSLSHHPAGVMHGPHPGAYEASIGQKATGELAVMLDCYRPLAATPFALGVEDAGYHESFSG